MFPHLSAAVMASHLERSLGVRVGAHSFRRSAIRSAIEAGVPLPDVILLSLHTATTGALPYALRPDDSQLARQAQERLRW